MESFDLTALPAPLSWFNEPAHVETDVSNNLTIAAGPGSDWFFDPSSPKKTSNAPVALFSPPDETCTLSAKVTVGFESTVDAGVLYITVAEHLQHPVFRSEAVDAGLFGKHS